MDASHIHHLPLLQEYPLLGYCITVTLAIFGNVMPLVAGDSHIPPIVMEVLQCIVWASGSLVGLFTLIGMWRNRNKK